jgi:hypothetical protein
VIDVITRALKGKVGPGRSSALVFLHRPTNMPDEVTLLGSPRAPLRAAVTRRPVARARPSLARTDATDPCSADGSSSAARARRTPSCAHVGVHAPRVPSAQCPRVPSAGLNGYRKYLFKPPLVRRLCAARVSRERTRPRPAAHRPQPATRRPRADVHAAHAHTSACPRPARPRSCSRPALRSASITARARAPAYPRIAGALTSEKAEQPLHCSQMRLTCPLLCLTQCCMSTCAELRTTDTVNKHMTGM